MGRWRGLVDAISDANGALSFGERRPDVGPIVEWLLDRQIVTGRGAGFFRPTDEDYAERRLPTGERLKTKLATSYIMSEEAARSLHLLAPQDPAVVAAVGRSTARLAETCFALQHCTIGECAASFIGYVRFQRSVLGDAATPDITWRLKTLAEHRDGSGRWKRFPPYYTLLVLSEIPLAAAEDELAYAKALWAPGGRVPPVEEPYAARRSQLLAALQARGV